MAALSEPGLERDWSEPGFQGWKKRTYEGGSKRTSSAAEDVQEIAEDPPKLDLAGLLGNNLVGDFGAN
jgi:hypothetical protein